MISNQTQGFSLIEVLVAVFVLALGIIGAAGLQLAAVRTSQQSGYQTIAVELANELADKMRSNDAQMKLSDAANVFASINYNSATDPDPTTPTLCYTSAANCNATDLAKADIYEWLVRVKKTLPAGRVLVCRDSSPFDSSTKALTWTCTSDPNAGLTIKLGWKSKNPDGSFVLTNGVNPPSVAVTVESYVK
ncbi:type IV pilus modification protein PilV [Undibacterium griseum]|uniref:Type IV pilus modification protein PilV n=1 Tax=Undibacterium griseum TaxID=2762295 RepID=A0ABR6YRT7_9BURK|nr:type IV pilus modification protein PilV [Undibacterium griseum]MBC3886480.1 type IV pilus modification protein PilV [Undibacterium griseum]